MAHKVYLSNYTSTNVRPAYLVKRFPKEEIKYPKVFLQKENKVLSFSKTKENENMIKFLKKQGFK